MARSTMPNHQVLAGNRSALAKLGGQPGGEHITSPLASPLLLVSHFQDGNSTATRHWLAWVLALMVLVGWANLAFTDEAKLSDGRTQKGELRLDKDRLQFTPAEGAQPALDTIRTFRFSPDTRTLPTGSVKHRITLRDGQTVLADLSTWKDDKLTVQTSWSQSLTIPRGEIAAIVWAGGYCPLVEEGFETEASVWELQGTPQRTQKHHRSGQWGLTFASPRQSGTRLVSQPLRHGRLTIHFLEIEASKASRWLFTAEFGGKESSSVSVALGETGKHYSIETRKVALKKENVVRESGWHRLQIDFSADALVVSVDNLVLAQSEERCVLGPLQKVKLFHEGSNDQPSGAIAVDDFSTARRLDHLSRPSTDPSQDAIQLLSGDQEFGKLVRLNHNAIEITSSESTRLWKWSELRGVELRREPRPLQTTVGQHVRLKLLVGNGLGHDEWTGTLSALEKDRLTLQHPTLGELRPDRKQLLEVQPLFHGRRVELDNDIRHLGEKDQAVPGFFPLKAESGSWKRTFSLEELPTKVVLRCSLRAPSSSVKGERPHVEVVLNGVVVQTLNVEDGGEAEDRLRSVLLPRTSLKLGENTLEVRIPAERKDHCLLEGVTLEQHR